jgi:hypothetical protein
MNDVRLIGRLMRKGELVTTSNGTAIATARRGRWGGGLRARYPREAPLLNGEFEVIALTTAEVCE